MTALLALLAASSKQGNPIVSLLVLALPIAAIFYLMVIPQRKQRAKQQAFLANHACDYLQGYLFGKPEPADRFSERLQRSWVMA